MRSKEQKQAGYKLKFEKAVHWYVSELTSLFKSTVDSQSLLVKLTMKCVKKEIKEKVALQTN